MITDLIENNSAKILVLFSTSPGSKFTRKEIKEKTAIHNLPLDKALEVLLSNKILNKEKRLYTLNFGNTNMKIILELMKKEHLRFRELPLKIYFIMMDVSLKLSGTKKIAQAYLFGSYAKLIYTEKSDVDIALILEEHDVELIKNIKKFISGLEKRTGKPIELHFFEKKDMKEKDPLIKEIIKNSVRLF